VNVIFSAFYPPSAGLCVNRAYFRPPLFLIEPQVNLALWLAGWLAAGWRLAGWLAGWLAPRAISEILPDGEKEKQLMPGWPNRKNTLEDASKEGLFV
jgi:hypothetical protein